MFRKSSKVVKIVAHVIFWLTLLSGIAASVLLAAVFMVDDMIAIVAPFVIVPVTALIGYVSASFLYGYAQIIESAVETRNCAEEIRSCLFEMKNAACQKNEQDSAPFDQGMTYHETVTTDPFPQKETENPPAQDLAAENPPAEAEAPADPPAEAAPSQETPPVEKLYRCPTCRNTIAFGAPSCPHCGTIFDWGKK